MTLVILAGPAACGKTHAARTLIAQRAQYTLARGAVTRPSRGADDNNDALLTPEEYRRCTGQLCLRREINGHHYGYFKQWIDEHLATGFRVLLPLMEAADVTETGEIWPCTRAVYLRPARTLLESRLRIRHAASPERIEHHLARAMEIVSELDQRQWGLVVDITADHRPVAALIDEFVVGSAR